VKPPSVQVQHFLVFRFLFAVNIVVSSASSPISPVAASKYYQGDHSKTRERNTKTASGDLHAKDVDMAWRKTVPDDCNHTTSDAQEPGTRDGAAGWSRFLTWTKVPQDMQ
jgi:hypothetical protein